MNAVEYLHRLLADAGIPLHGCAIVTATQPGWHVVQREPGVLVRIDYNGATPEQIAQGDALVLSHDLSPSVIAAREESLKPERKSLRALASQALADNQTYLAIAAPTAAQVRAQTEALTRQMNAVIRRLVQLD